MDELAICFALCIALIIVVILIVVTTRKPRCPCGCIPSECSCPASCPNCTCSSENFKALKDIPHHRRTVAHVKRAARRSAIDAAASQVYGPDTQPGQSGQSGETEHFDMENNHYKSGLPPVHDELKSKSHYGAYIVNKENYTDPYLQAEHDRMMAGDRGRYRYPNTHHQHYEDADLKWHKKQNFHTHKNWFPPHRINYGKRRFSDPPIFPVVLDDDSIYTYVQQKGYIEYNRPFDPCHSDDLRSGHRKGSVWRNTASNKMFVLVDESIGLAKWMLVQDVTPMTDRISPMRGPGVQTAIPSGGAKQYMKHQVADYKHIGMHEETNVNKKDTDKKQTANIMNLIQ